MEMRPGGTDIETREYHFIDGGARIEIKWQLCMQDGSITTHFTRMKAPQLKTKRQRRDALRELRAKAEKTAERLMCKVEDDVAAAQGRRVWRDDALLSEYIDKVSSPRLEDDPSIRDSTRQRYRYLLRRVRELTAGLPISAITSETDKSRTVQNLLLKAERGHGTTAAVGIRSILVRYVLKELVIDGVVEEGHLPITDVSWRRIDKGTSRRSEARRSGLAIADDVIVVTPEERARVVRWLLEDPCEVVGQYGRMTLKEASAQRRALVEITLLQATCGFRLTELMTLTARHVSVDSDGYAVVEVTPEASKTGRGRRVGMFDGEFGAAVSERLLARVDRLGPDDYVFPSSMTGKRWNIDNARHAMRRFYDEIADVTDVPTLRLVSTHVWRASLNCEYEELHARGLSGFDADTRAALFGHSVSVQQRYYTAGITPEQQRDWAGLPHGSASKQSGRVIHFRRTA